MLVVWDGWDLLGFIINGLSSARIVSGVKRWNLAGFLFGSSRRESFIFGGLTGWHHWYLDIRKDNILS